jgi:hypothetical protein
VRPAGRGAGAAGRGAAWAGRLPVCQADRFGHVERALELAARADEERAAALRRALDRPAPLRHSGVAWLAAEAGDMPVRGTESRSA